MWTAINDCGKQLVLHSKLRETDDGDVKIHKIIEIEYDQYKVELISTNGLPATEKLHNVLSCRQLVKYNFEVKENDEEFVP